MACGPNGGRQERSLQPYKNHELAAFLGIRRLLTPISSPSNAGNAIGDVLPILLTRRRLLVATLSLLDQDSLPAIRLKIPPYTESA